MALLMPLGVCAQENTESNKINLADIPVLVGTHFLLNVALGLAHQLGPILAAKLFIACGAEFSEPNETPDANVKLTGACLDASVPEFKSALLNICMYGSAPLTGLLGCICALKSANILNEYHKTNNMKKAFLKGLRKDLFNEDQPTTLKGWVLVHLAMNSFDCVPRFYQRPDEQIGGNSGAQMRYWIEQYFRKNKQ